MFIKDFFCCFADNRTPMLFTSQQVMLQPASHPAAKKQRFSLDMNVDISSDPSATVVKSSNAAFSSAQGNFY